MDLKELSKYRDVYGLLVQADRDGGDSCNRTMAANCYFSALNVPYTDEGLMLTEALIMDLTQLAGSAPGRYRRNPAPNRWFNNENNFTRDQSIVLQAALVLNGQVKWAALDLLKARAKRLMFHFSTENDGQDAGPLVYKAPDICAPIEIAQFIRCFRWTTIILYPLLCLLDLQLLIDVAIVRPLAKAKGNKDFDVQYLPIILSCIKVGLTPTGMLAHMIYARTSNVESELRRYFSEEAGNNGLHPLGELACEAYRKVICGI